MLKTTMIALLGVVLAAGASVGAETKDEGTSPACKTAEINPVTGHVMCIDPLGAAVDAPPEYIAPPCDADQSRGQWTWAPNCVPRGDGASGLLFEREPPRLSVRLRVTIKISAQT